MELAWPDTVAVPSDDDAATAASFPFPSYFSSSSSSSDEASSSTARHIQWRSGLALVAGGKIDYLPGQGLAIQSLKKRTTTTTTTTSTTSHRKQTFSRQRFKSPATQQLAEEDEEDEESSKKKAHLVNDERRASVVLSGRTVPALAKDKARAPHNSGDKDEGKEDHEEEEAALVVPDEVLLKVVKQGDWAAFEEYITRNRARPTQRIQYNPNCTDGMSSVLFYASEGGHEEFVSFLLEGGAEVDAKNQSGVTPLFIAAQVGATNVVRLLMDHGADPYLRSTPDDVLPLYVACFEGHLDVVKELLLFHNLKEREEQAGGSEQHISMVNMVGVGADGNTPLMACCERGHLDIVEFLLANGAEKDARGKSGETALFWAVQQEFPVLAELLISQGSNVNTQKNDGATPLFMAVLGGDRRMVDLLLLHGARNDIATHAGETPSNVARRMGRHDIANSIIGVRFSSLRP